MLDRRLGPASRLFESVGWLNIRWRSSLVPWLRQRSTSFILFAVLLLSIAGIGLSIFMDHRHQSWTSDNPMTAGLLAGFLGLPAAFLIVNLAADRAIDWSDRTKWEAVREQEAAGVVKLWERARPALAYRYAFEGELAKRLPAPNFIARLDELIFDFEMRGTASQPQKSAGEVRSIIFEIEERKSQLSAARVRNEDDIYRERLRTRLLPELETANREPELVAMVKATIDELIDLELSWEFFVDIGGGPYQFLLRGDRSDTAAYLVKANQSEFAFPVDLNHLRDTRALFVAAKNTLVTMDALVAKLTV